MHPNTRFSPAAATLTSISTLTSWLGACAGMALLASGSVGCAAKNSNNATDAPGADSGINPVSANVTYAKGWNSLDLAANSAKNSLDPSGHYHTDKNMCQQPGDGVFDVATWNRIAVTLNQTVLTAALPAPRCWDSPNGSKFYNTGIAELVLASGEKRKLYEYKNGQICTTVADPELADSLMAQIETALQLLDKADAESCPNYHPGS